MTGGIFNNFFQSPEEEQQSPPLPNAICQRAALPNYNSLNAASANEICSGKATLPNVASDASLTTPEDVDPDSLSGGPQTSTDDDNDDDDDPKTVVDKNRGSSFESSRDLDSEDFEPECSFRDKEVQFCPSSASTRQSVCASRSSVDSHKSISFFIDLVKNLKPRPEQARKGCLECNIETKS